MNLLNRVFPFLSFTICGNSMFPTLSSGDKVLVQRKWFFCKFKEKEIVALKDPRDGKVIIKRIKSIRHPGKSRSAGRIQDLLPQQRKRFWTSQNDDKLEYFVVGDNTDKSTDSRKFGWINENDIIGKVIL